MVQCPWAAAMSPGDRACTHGSPESPWAQTHHPKGGPSSPPACCQHNDQPQADGAGSTLPGTAAGTAHRGTAQSTEGRFCCVSRGQPPAERRWELQRTCSSMSLTLLPHCEALAGFPPLQGSCRARMWQRCWHPPALAPSHAACTGSMPWGRAPHLLPSCMSGITWEKSPATGKEQVRETCALPYCTINHEKFFLLSCMKQNLAGRSDHRDLLLALQ